MNKLSWMLYLADVCQGIGVFLILATIASFVMFVLMTIIRTVTAVSDDKPVPALSRSSVAGLLAMGLAACLFPSSKTVYMIAASEAGERIAATAEAREMLDLVRQKLKTVLTDKT